MPSAATGMAALKPRASHSTRPQESSEVSLRRLRKRETDRRCQREARERTKSRIAYLEALVEELRGREAMTEQKLREVEAEKEGMLRTMDRLRTALNPQGPKLLHVDNINNINRAASSSSSSSSSPPPPPPPPDPIPLANTSFPQDNSYLIQPGIVTCLDEDAVLIATDSPSVFTDTASVFTTAFDETDVNCQDYDYASSSFATHSPYPSQSVVATAQPQTARDKEASAAGGHMSCGACGSHISRRSGQSALWQGNFWRFACEVLEERFEWPAGLQPASDMDSDDVPIRALLHGWDAVRRENPHPIWMLLSRIDEFLFPSMPKPERLAMLKAMHLLLQFSLQPNAERFMSLPPWYSYKPSQQHLPHAYAMDFFAWPGFRERFVLNPHAYCGNDFWFLYQNNMRLLWPSDFADCFTRDPLTGLFKTTVEFDTRVGDINSWTMGPDFFARFPELLSDIPATNSIPQPVSLGLGRMWRWRKPGASLPSTPAPSVGGGTVEGADQQGDQTPSVVEAELWSPAAAAAAAAADEMCNLDFMPSLSMVSGRTRRTLLPMNEACLSL